MLPPSRRALIAFAIALGLAPSAAFACAACGCGDPSMSEIGIPDTDAGGGVAGLAFEGRRDVIGGDVQTDTRVSALGIWTATPDLQVYFRAPFTQRTVGSAKSAGAGDVDLGTTVVVFRKSGISHGQTVMAQAQVTLPAGRHDERNLDLNPGSGATSTQFGAAWFAHRKQWRAYASLAWRHALVPGAEYTPGDVRLFNVGLQRPLTAEALDGTLEINGKDELRSHWPLGTTVSDTGGTVAYLTPGILLTLGPTERRWFTRASVQIPVFSDTWGRQHPGPVAQLGLFKSF